MNVVLGLSSGLMIFTLVQRLYGQLLHSVVAYTLPGTSSAYTDKAKLPIAIIARQFILHKLKGGVPQLYDVYARTQLLFMNTSEEDTYDGYSSRRGYHPAETTSPRTIRAGRIQSQGYINCYIVDLVS